MQWELLLLTASLLGMSIGVAQTLRRLFTTVQSLDKKLDELLRQIPKT